MNPSSVDCPLCGNSEIRYFMGIAHDSNIHDDSVSIRICESCDFAWQWPLGRSVDQSKDFFLSEYQAGRGASYFDAEARIQIAELQLGFIKELGVRSTTLLDIGCGDGTFGRAAASSGWNVVGIDPAIPPENVAISHNSNPKLIRCTLDQLDPNDKFSCVTLWDVIEHFPEPELLLSNAWGRVLPGGWLIIETGNFQSAERLLAAQNWWAWQLDHRWYFSPTTLLHLLKPLDYSKAVLAKRVFRPWASGRFEYEAPSKLQTVLSVIKRPWRKDGICQEHRIKREAKTRWPEWAGLQIFSIAIQK